MNAEQECPVDGCSNVHSLQHVMCRRCWRIVPRELATRIYRAWETRQRWPSESSRREHQAAKDDAIRFVSKRLPPRQQKLGEA